jgi:hypothetical protein
VREFSAEREVIAVRRAMRLTRGRRDGEEAYDETQDEVLAELHELRGDQVAQSAAIWDLVNALVRFGSLASGLATVRGQGTFTDEETMQIIETSLMESSIECDPDVTRLSDPQVASPAADRNE